MAYEVIEEIVHMSMNGLEDGLHDKYIVTKTSGKPLDPEAKYFVLRYDNDEDALFAAQLWAIRKNKMGLYEELKAYGQEQFGNGDTIS